MDPNEDTEWLFSIEILLIKGTMHLENKESSLQNLQIQMINLKKPSNKQ